MDFAISGRIYVLELNSVICTGYTDPIRPLLLEKGIDTASVAVDTALAILNER